MHRTGFCKPLIHTLKILNLQSQYILSMMTFLTIWNIEKEINDHRTQLFIKYQYSYMFRPRGSLSG